MDFTLLTAKLRIPPLPQRPVHRTRLIDTLEHDIPHVKLTLVSAPAGYGKSTLLAQWARSSDLTVAWLSVDASDNDIQRFLRYLLKAWERIQSGIEDSPLGLLLGGSAYDGDAVLPAFINAADTVPGTTVFVLDDYHLINDPAIHHAMTFLLDHLPPQLHIVMGSRAEPPLPIARYRAHGKLREIRAEDLRFRPDEAAAFLNDLTNVDLPPGQAAALQEQTEGWIAGLHLAGLTLRRAAPDNELAISGRQRFIADYLREEVLALLTPDQRQFMLQTSILDNLCGPLCDAITGRTDSQMMLEELEQQNLFTLPLDETRQWFRYHRLFADFLRGALQRQQPGDIGGLHRRAAQWYLTHDLPEQAFQHAAAGESAELVSQILDRYLMVKLLGGEIKLLRQWLRALPEAWTTTVPMIVLAQAGVLLATGQFDACAHRLDQVERVAAERANTGLYRARVTALRCNIACFQNDLAQAEMLADRALQNLPEADLDFRAGLYGALGDTYRRNGRWAEARASYYKLLNFTEAPAFRVQAVHIYGALADLELQQGRLHSAADYWRNALATIQQPGNWGTYPLPLTGWVYTRLGEILYEWNELNAASEHLSNGLERAELGGDVQAVVAAYLLAGRLRLAAGDFEAAEAYLHRARPHIHNAQYPYWANRLQRLQLDVWLAQGEQHAALQRIDEMLAEARTDDERAWEAVQIAAARVLIVTGSGPDIERALALLKPLIPVLEDEGRMGVRIEALALQALALYAHGEESAALITLEQALRLAEPEGYCRLFVDLGLPMARLLQEAHSRGVMPAAVETLLAASEALFATQAGQDLPEPLTPREQEILALLAAGLTNAEIAAQLVISPGTVKKHAGNIYGKLGVGNRTEAAARARELGLLS